MLHTVNDNMTSVCTSGNKTSYAKLTWLKYDLHVRTKYRFRTSTENLRSNETHLNWSIKTWCIFGICFHNLSSGHMRNEQQWDMLVRTNHQIISCNISRTKLFPNFLLYLSRNLQKYVQGMLPQHFNEIICHEYPAKRRIATRAAPTENSAGSGNVCCDAWFRGADQLEQEITDYCLKQ